MAARKRTALEFVRQRMHIANCNPRLGTAQIDVWVSSNDSDLKNWMDMYKISPMNEHVKLGFDVEWRPNFAKGEENKIALIQLATAESVFLFHIKHFNGGPLQHLRSLIGSNRVYKVGVGILEDLRKLHVQYGIPFGAYRDLGLAARRIDRAAEEADSLGAAEADPPSPPPAAGGSSSTNASALNRPSAATRGGYSLSGLYQRVFGVTLPKARSVRCSNWEAHPLSNSQIQYSAWDALSALHLQEYLERRRRKGVAGVGSCEDKDTDDTIQAASTESAVIHDNEDGQALCRELWELLRPDRVLLSTRSQFKAAYRLAEESSDAMELLCDYIANMESVTPSQAQAQAQAQEAERQRWGASANTTASTSYTNSSGQQGTDTTAPATAAPEHVTAPQLVAYLSRFNVPASAVAFRTVPSVELLVRRVGIHNAMNLFRGAVGEVASGEGGASMGAGAGAGAGMGGVFGDDDMRMGMGGAEGTAAVAAQISMHAVQQKVASLRVSAPPHAHAQLHAAMPPAAPTTPAHGQGQQRAGIVGFVLVHDRLVGWATARSKADAVNAVAKEVLGELLEIQRSFPWPSVPFPSNQPPPPLSASPLVTLATIFAGRKVGPGLLSVPSATSSAAAAYAASYPPMRAVGPSSAAAGDGSSAEDAMLGDFPADFTEYFSSKPLWSEVQLPKKNPSHDAPRHAPQQTSSDSRRAPRKKHPPRKGSPAEAKN